jgi:hypothetical protein
MSADDQTPHLDYLDHAYPFSSCLSSSYHFAFRTTHTGLLISSYPIQSLNQSSTSFKSRINLYDMVSLSHVGENEVLTY